MRDVKPALDKDGIKLVAVGIGYPEIGREFCELTGFDPTLLYADPENVMYEALELEKSVASLAFSPQTPFSLANRVVQGRFQDLSKALQSWKVWIPPRLSQGLQQGGVYVFDGRTAVFEHKDAGTGAFANLDQVLSAAASSAACKTE